MSLIRDLALQHEYLFTIEEGSKGGFGSLVLHYLSDSGLLDGKCKVRCLTMPDEYINQMSVASMLSLSKLDSASIVDCVSSVLDGTNPAIYAV